MRFKISFEGLHCDGNLDPKIHLLRARVAADVKIRIKERLFLNDACFPVFEFAEQLQRWLGGESKDVFKFETYSAQETPFLVFDCSETTCCQLWSAHQEFEGAVVPESELRSECEKFVEEFSAEFSSRFGFEFEHLVEG